MQSVVDFLQDEILKDRMVKAKSIKEWHIIINKARDMFEKQIIDAWIDGDARICQTKSIPHAEQYYNETYGSKGSDEKGIMTPENHVDVLCKAISSQTPKQ